MLIDGATWGWVKDLQREASKLTTAEYAGKLSARLGDDFDQAFAAIKTQKLISISRDVEITRAIARALTQDASNLHVSGKRRSLLRRHCEVTLFFQELFSEIQARTANLSIWQLSFSEVSRALLNSVETLAFDQSFVFLPTYEENPSFTEILSGLEYEIRRLRDRCDYANIVINEARTRCRGERADITSVEEVIETVRIAEETEDAQALWSHYTFTDIEASVVSGKLILGDLAPNITHAGDVSARRLNSNDIDVNQKVLTLFLELRREHVEAIQTSNSVALFPFLVSAEGEKVLRAFDGATDALTKLLLDKIDDLVDVDEKFELPGATFSYADLTTFWAFLYRFSFVLRVVCLCGAAKQRKNLSGL